MKLNRGDVPRARLAACALLLCLRAAPTPAQSVAPAEAAAAGNPGTRSVHCLHVQGGVYLLSGGGANITVQVGAEAVVVVNAGRAEMSDAVLAAIRSLSPRPIEYVIDTSGDADDIGGNAALSKAGFANSGQRGEPTTAAIVAQLNVLKRMNSANTAPAATPTDTYERDWALFNDEAILLTHAPAAHSDGDSYVFFRRSDVISTGYLFDPASYPVIDEDHGGSIDGIIDALNAIIHIMVPRQNEEGGTYVIPGHGRVCDHTDIVNYRDALTIIRARVRYYVAKGMTLEQVRAAKPTFDYDGIYGSDRESESTSRFIAAVYREVSLAAKAHGIPSDWRQNHG